MKIAKFGGSSLADAFQIKKVCDIILSDPDRRIIVVSAPGKRNKEDITENQKRGDSIYEFEKSN